MFTEEFLQLEEVASIYLRIYVYIQLEDLAFCRRVENSVLNGINAGNKTDQFLFEDMDQRGAEVLKIDHIKIALHAFKPAKSRLSRHSFQCFLFFFTFKVTFILRYEANYLE